MSAPVIVAITLVGFAWAGALLLAMALTMLVLCCGTDRAEVSPSDPRRRAQRGGPMFTIHEMPNGSTHMPNSSPHICFSSGMTTLPPFESLSQ